jgi:hypothetical protein
MEEIIEFSRFCKLLNKIEFEKEKKKKINHLIKLKNNIIEKNKFESLYPFFRLLLPNFDKRVYNLKEISISQIYEDFFKSKFNNFFFKKKISK